MLMNKKACTSCSRQIDEWAKLCPYCGANPETGEKFDATPIVQAHFPPRAEMGWSEKFLSFFRARQGVVVTVVLIGAVVILSALHQFVVSRNETEVRDVPAIALTEAADLAGKSRPTEAPLPEVTFTFDGNPQTMQTFLVEPGAVAPAPMVPFATPTTTTTQSPTTTPTVRVPGLVPLRQMPQQQPGATTPASQQQQTVRPTTTSQR
jgi:hypothetical protein